MRVVPDAAWESSRLWMPCYSIRQGWKGGSGFQYERTVSAMWEVFTHANLNSPSYVLVVSGAVSTANQLLMEKPGGVLP